MKHLKTYEYDYYDKKFQKYVDFIIEKFEIKNHSFGDAKYSYITDDGLKMYIELGYEIEPNYLASIIDFFKECEGKITIPNHGGILNYNLLLSFDFLKKINIEIDSKTYNL